MKQFARLCLVMAGVLAMPALPSRAALALAQDAAAVASPLWIARGGGGVDVTRLCRVGLVRTLCLPQGI
jgi:hypothetical protein